MWPLRWASSPRGVPTPRLQSRVRGDAVVVKAGTSAGAAVVVCVAARVDGAARRAAVTGDAPVAAEKSVATMEGAEERHSKAALPQRPRGHLTHLPAYGCR